jgi:uncharacterized protein (TIGR00730 family)
MTTGDHDERIRAILESPAYRMAEADSDFLESDAARASRLALEFMRADFYLREHGIESTVVVFGGSRIRSPPAAQEWLLQTERSTTDPSALARARAGVAWSHYYEETRSLARILSSSQNGKPRRDFVIVTGGGPGIMEAANRGAADCGAPSIGFNIDLPLEQLPNAYITPSLALRFRYFALRKMHFLLRAKALVAFPGGYGTLDEVFESLNLVQTHKIEPIPIVLVGAAHWQRVLDFDYLIEQGFITQQERELACVVETGAQAAQVILDFHRRLRPGEARRRQADRELARHSWPLRAAHRARRYRRRTTLPPNLAPAPCHRE